MSKNMSATNHAEVSSLLKLTSRIGVNPLLTQASTGNTSIKLDGVLWIKASGKWMADATHDDILIPLELAEVRQCVKQGVDPAERYTAASIETAMHAVLPHRVVVHVHSVNTIALAVRQDGPSQLRSRLNGLHWRWIPYVPSGLPLAREIGKVMSARPDTDLLVLGNHGLIVCGDDCTAVESLLADVERCLAVCPRPAHPADYSVLAEIAKGSQWDLPDDEGVHALATDTISQAMLSEGFLYPCQAIFSGRTTPALFRPVPCPEPGDQWGRRYCTRPFLILEGRGVVVGNAITPAERAMISGLAQVVQRIGASAPLRYLTRAEVGGNSSMVASRYRELANARRNSAA
ncbi:MAG TPA: class II aldolase/adducin family protein [Bryobacteraceae bacterium]|nr:class II aldolase/adducin family protein [Bryobacteraceae bacterium]